MKILVVDSGDGMRTSVSEALAPDGHEIVHAHGCADALQQFARSEPDMVLMDVALCDGDGYQCARRIQAMAAERFVPVILATAIECEVTLRHFLESGASDFLDAPHDPLLLRAKIGGFEHSRKLYRKLEALQEKFHHEVRFAKHVFDAVIVRNPDMPQGIDSWTLGAGHFCGDLLIHARTPDGRLNIMLADFTGHGLAAAVGALPASDVFFAMSHKGMPLEEIVREINTKLHRLLPTGRFCSATVLSLAANGHIEAWIGGQPPIWLLDEDRRELCRITSQHLPLGVLGDKEFCGRVESVELESCHHLLLYSDGLIEARNASGEMFGEARLREVLEGQQRRRSRKTSLLQGIKTRLVAFLDGLEPHDDVSVMAVELPALGSA